MAQNKKRKHTMYNKMKSYCKLNLF